MMTSEGLRKKCLKLFMTDKPLKTKLLPNNKKKINNSEGEKIKDIEKTFLKEEM